MAIKHACTHSDCREEGIFTVEDGEHLCMQHIHKRISWLPRRPRPPRRASLLQRKASLTSAWKGAALGRYQRTPGIK
jgi:hypothetical protein